MARAHSSGDADDRAVLQLAEATRRCGASPSRLRRLAANGMLAAKKAGACRVGIEAAVADLRRWSVDQDLERALDGVGERARPPRHHPRG